MIRNYIFDLYGTLVDIRTDEAMASLWKRMALLLSLQGADYSSKGLRIAYISAINELIERRAEEHPAIQKDHIEPEILYAFQSLYTQKGIMPSMDTVKDTALFFRTLSMRHIRLYPHATTVLRMLRTRGKGVYLLSNAQAAFTMPELEKLGLLPLFDGIVLSSDVGIKKPDSAIFQQLLSQYRLCPEECLMIGNDGVADIWGAAAAGMGSRYIHTKQSPDRPDLLPENCKEIRSLQELL